MIIFTNFFFTSARSIYRPIQSFFHLFHRFNTNPCFENLIEQTDFRERWVMSDGQWGKKGKTLLSTINLDKPLSLSSTVFSNRCLLYKYGSFLANLSSFPFFFSFFFPKLTIYTIEIFNDCIDLLFSIFSPSFFFFFLIK